jgi:hypothetical protein
MSCVLTRLTVTLTGKGYIDASTVSTAASAQIAEEVQRTGARFLEAPVSGSKQPAETGTLIFLAAGQPPAPTPGLCSGLKSLLRLGKLLNATARGSRTPTDWICHVYQALMTVPLQKVTEYSRLVLMSSASACRACSSIC